MSAESSRLRENLCGNDATSTESMLTKQDGYGQKRKEEIERTDTPITIEEEI